jgi:TonB family protein
VKLRYSLEDLFAVAHYPIPEPERDSDAQRPRSSTRLREALPGSRKTETLSFESDLAELVAKFSSEEGGNLSAELSADLALEVVLNEIVEQACLATGASGAAVILERDGEWVCRASSGGSAPELGARLNSEAGLTAECVKTRQAQRCDNAETDTRAEVEACRNLGVRSLVALPLFQNAKLEGVFAVFSAQAFAFEERENRTLEALCGYVLSSLAQARAPMHSVEARAQTQTPSPTPDEPTAEAQSGGNAIGKTRAADTVTGNTTETKESDSFVRFDLLEHAEAVPQPLATTRSRTIGIITWVMAAAVLAITGLLTTVASQRLLEKGPTAHRVSPHAGTGSGDKRTVDATAATPGPASNGRPNASGPLASSAPGSGPSAAAGAVQATTNTGGTGEAESSKDDGSLTVYENGKEVFHMPPAATESKARGETSSTDNAAQTNVSAERPLGTDIVAQAGEGGLIHRVEPDYPQEARQRKIEGAVVLDFWVSPAGSVRQVKLVSGPPLLADAAESAVKQWQFNPHLVNGKPAEMRSRVTLNFKLPADAHTN